MGDLTKAKPQLELRAYQRECIDAVEKAGSGRHLVVMATGLGKTVTFASLPRRGCTLILSHRDELVRQPERYFDCSYGVEKAGESSHGEEVVSASVQTLSRRSRLERFEPGDFDTVITDEAHHAVADGYRRIIDHLRPRVHLGFTATPNRNDKIGLKAVFDDIVFARDIRWGIANGYLSDIECMSVTVDWDTAGIRQRAGDFALGDLDEAVNTVKTNKQVAQAVRDLAVGQTLVFATSVAHAWELCKLIPGSVVVDGKTPPAERRAIIEAFTARRFSTLINFGVFTEGTDLPLIETVVLARPTSNVSLYTQMVGRGLRLSPGKEALRLIDCMGASNSNKLCTAPSLLGLDLKDMSAAARKVVSGRLSRMEERIMAADDCPEGWVLRARKVDVFARGSEVAWMTLSNGVRIAGVGPGKSVELRGPDLLGNFISRIPAIDGEESLELEFPSFEDADREVARILANSRECERARSLWDSDHVSKWANDSATGSQLALIRRLVGDEVADSMPKRLTKREAGLVIDNAKAKGASKEHGPGRDALGVCPSCGLPMVISASGKTYQCSSNKWRKKGREWALKEGCGTQVPADEWESSGGHAPDAPFEEP